MPKIQYIIKRLNAKTLGIVDKANQIIEDYATQGYSLTLRQLYYQFVARDLIENSQKSYKRLGATINDARLVGLIDWEAIEDRTRNLQTLGHWSHPGSIISSCARSFNVDLWEGQTHRVEVWVEKDALIGVLEKACKPLDVPYFSCRGYTSQSELWRAAQRHKSHERHSGQYTTVLHLGDLDPSGVDMTRDITDRLDMFGANTDVKRIALNMDQVRKYQPPPNPAKVSDSRFHDYARKYGNDSWELDALEPRVMHSLINHEIEQLIDDDAFNDRRKEQEEGRDLLEKTSDNWPFVVDFLRNRD